jgi:tetratricopeptide (TPR) repeat protein
MIHLFKKIALTLLIAVSFQTTAQNTISETKVDSLLQVLHLPNLNSLLLITDQVPLSNLYDNTITKNREKIKKATLHKLFQKIEKLAAGINNHGLEMYAGLWQYYIESKNYNTEYECNTELEEIAKKATNSGVLWVEITAKFSYAYSLVNCKDDFKNIEKGIWLLRENIEKILKKKDASVTKLTLAEHYRVLTGCYYDIDDIPNAIIYSIKALKIEYPRGSKLISANEQIFNSLNNNLGVYYREQNQLDSSTFYFKKVFDLPLTKNSSHRDSIYAAVSVGNLGENLYLIGKYKDALPLLQRDAEITIKLKSWGNASNALILIADIYLREGDIEKAKQTLDKATFAAHSSKEIKRISKLYAILSKYYKTIGQLKIALIYADSTILALDSIKRKNNQFRGTNIENTYNKHQVKIASENELKTKNSNIRSRDGGLFFLTLLLFIGYVIFRKFKLKVKQQESNLENNVLQVANKLYLKEEELKNKIQEFTVQNNAVNWRDFKINSDEEWRKFLILFQKEHPEFIFYIKSKFSSITAGEIRLLCLTRLELDDIVIASILSVNVNSISQTRRRFMRKSEIENLKELKGLVFRI